MRSRLDQIEARLQGLIESSLALFARGDDQHRLAHQLVSAAQENLQSNGDGRQIAPNQYTIYLHPESLAYWQANRDRLDSIAKSLQQAAWEYGVQFLSEPVLTLAPDTRLPQDGLRVVAADFYESPGGTAAFPIQTSPAPASIPRNAFLIVDGNRIFPLNRTVINIGRRPDNHLVLNDSRVSRAHAQIRANRGQYVLFDLNSTGGTLVNGRRVSQCALKPGDVISLSGVPLIYGEESPDEDTEDLGFTQSMNSAEDGPPEIIG
jgi:hypothetical protein